MDAVDARFNAKYIATPFSTPTRSSPAWAKKYGGVRQ